MSNLTVGNDEEACHHVIDIIVFKIRVVSDWRVTAELVPAEALRRIVAIRKDPCWLRRQGTKKKKKNSHSSVPEVRTLTHTNL